MDYASSGIYITQPSVTAESAQIDVQANVVNRTAQSETVRVRTTIRDADNTLVTQAETSESLAGGADSFLTFSLTVDDPYLWDGVDDPYLYTVINELLIDDVVYDVVTEKLGLRSYFIDPDKGFFLNGRHVKLRGVNRHQDRRDKGWAISDAERLEDMNLITEMGTNSIRVAHYQQSEYWYDLCDERGMVVWAEIPFVDGIRDNNDFRENAREQLRELIRQNFNHPSICFWGVGNEITQAKNTAASLCDELLVDLENVASSEDPHRPTTFASNRRNYLPAHSATDLVGWNLYFGWYYGIMSGFGGFYDTMHSRCPDLKMCVSEYGVGANIYQHEENPAQPAPKGDWFPQEYQNIWHESHWAAIKSRHYLWGSYIWNMFDFAADHRSNGGIAGMNLKGMVSHDRKTKKDTFYYYKANWNLSDKFVHLTSKEAVNRSNIGVEVKVYSNCSTVELFIDNVSAGVAAENNGTFKWNGVSIADGQSVRAVGDGIHEDVLLWNEGIAPGQKIKVTSVSAGSEELGNPAVNSCDGNNLSRWANDNTPANAWIEYHFDSAVLCGLKLKLYRGENRRYQLRITSGDTLLYEGLTDLGPEFSVTFPHLIADTVLVTMTTLNSDGSYWLSIYETDLIGLPPAVHPGLNYEYHESIGNHPDSFSGMQAVRSGVGYDFELTERMTDEQIGFVWEGFLNVPASGDYTFYLASTGSVDFFLDRNPTGTFRDGESGQVTVNLANGSHEVRILFSHQTETPALQLEWEGPFCPRQPVHPELFSYLLLRDIGETQLSGSTVAGPNSIAINAAGYDIWGTQDEFSFLNKPLSGDVEITVRVDSLQNTDPQAKAGIMIRNSQDPSSACAAFMITPENGGVFQRRLTDGSTTTGTSVNGPTAGSYLKLVRRGSKFYVYWSPDNIVWNSMLSDTIEMQEDVYVGLCAVSHSASVRTRAVFSQLEIRRIPIAIRTTIFTETELLKLQTRTL